MISQLHRRRQFLIHYFKLILHRHHPRRRRRLFPENQTVPPLASRLWSRQNNLRALRTNSLYILRSRNTLIRTTFTRTFTNKNILEPGHLAPRRNIPRWAIRRTYIRTRNCPALIRSRRMTLLVRRLGLTLHTSILIQYTLLTTGTIRARQYLTLIRITIRTSPR